jgi:RNA-binding protein
METATSPKKKSLMPAGPLRRTLRAKGHALAAIVLIGKSGVTAAVLKQIAQALFEHELVKVKVGSECPDNRLAVAHRLATQPGTNLVQMVGRTFLLYKRHPSTPKFEGPSSKATPDS